MSDIRGSFGRNQTEGSKTEKGGEKKYTERDAALYNRYVRLAECYEGALAGMSEALGEAREKLLQRYRQLEAEKDSIRTDIINDSGIAGEGNEAFYSVLYRLNLSTDIDSCKKTAVMLKDYLTENPGSVMGDTLLKVIREQLED